MILNASKSLMAIMEIRAETNLLYFFIVTTADILFDIKYTQCFVMFLHIECWNALYWTFVVHNKNF